MTRLFALVDCNSFFCSCERVYRPHLNDKPVVVLSNNDGCVVSLTPEAKKVGIKMGDVFFKIKDKCKFHGVNVFSSNFALYGNMSDRVMKILSEFTPTMEVYSIDEAFLLLDGFDHFDLQNHCHELRAKVLRETSIPVSVGLAPTKVLAKLGNNWAKKNPAFKGVVDLRDSVLLDLVLAGTPVGDIWGVGRQTAIKLNSLGIKTARDFRDYKNDSLIQKYLHKPGRQMQDELRGEVCFSLSPSTAKKSILVSRSFDHQVKEKKEMIEAITKHTMNASRKLREEKQVCRMITASIRTNPFKDLPQHHESASFKFSSATSNSGEILKAALTLLDTLYKEGLEYKKCGVCLMDFEPENETQLDLFSIGSEKSTLMKLADEIHLMISTGKKKVS
ncbi:MAG: Y-family DNA polymerase [Bacteriovoracaceae bacterium]